MVSLRVGSVVLVLGLAACSSRDFLIGSNPDSGRSDTGPVDTGPVDTGPVDTGPVDTGRVDGGPSTVCTDLVPSGLEIQAVFKSGAPPELGQGGTLFDGVYDLTQATIYQSAPTPQQFLSRASIRVTGNGTVIELANDQNATGIVATVAPSGNALNATVTCPLGQGVGLGPYFTASINQIELINGLHAEVYTRRAGTTPDAGPRPDSDAGPGPTIAGECGDLVPGGALVVEKDEPGPAPEVAIGGMPSDGVYDLTQMTRYNQAGAGGSSTTTDQERIRISGGGTRLEYVSGVYNFSMLLSIAPSNGTLNDTVLCPADEPSFNMFVGPYYQAAGDSFLSIGQNHDIVKVFARGE